MKKNPALPTETSLPSGRRVRLSDRAARAAAQHLGRRDDSLALAVSLLSAPGVLSDADGSPLSPGPLRVEDVQVLRAFLVRSGILRERAHDYTCENCDEAFRTAPTRVWEPGPFVDGELDDPELDEAFDYARDYDISPLRVGRQMAWTVRLAPRTVEESEALWCAASSRLRALPKGLTPSLVTAMGLTSFGTERRMSKLVAALTAVNQSAWADVVDIVHAAHYPPRLVAAHRCGQCGAKNLLDVPAARELPRAGPPSTSPRGGGFMALDVFEEIVRRHAPRVYRRRGVKNIALWIDDDVPLCDDGGEPLLGCYTPPGTDPLISSQEEPEIRIFYRTFQMVFRGVPEREVEREIQETIDHEVTHHLHFLAGADPLDDAERAEIFEEERRIVGRAETGRRSMRRAGGDLLGFLRAAWPLLLLAFVFTMVAFCR